MLHRVHVRVFDDEPLQEIVLPRTIDQYHELWQHIDSFRETDQGTYQALLRCWTAGDGYFLLRFVMSAGRNAWNHFRHEPHFDDPAHIQLARIIQFDPAMDDTVLVGARGLGKSSHFDADDLRQLLLDPMYCILFFSLTKQLAEQHAALLGEEMEKNELLKFAWPDRFWASEQERKGQSSMVPWSASQGYNIKRPFTRLEKSIEAASFEYALPTGKHPDRRRYDDIEADRSVRSELTQDTLEERWTSSQHLTSSRRCRRVTGTYYHPNALMVRLSLELGMKVAKFPGEDTDRPAPPEHAGPLGGTPSNGFTREELWRTLEQMGGAEKDEDGNWRKTSNARALTDYGRQVGCDPLAGEAAKLDWRWLRVYDGDGSRFAREVSVVVCADCSKGAKDPTAIWVWGLTPDKTFIWLDAELRVVDPKARRELLHEVCQRWVNLGAKVEQLRLEQFGQAQYVEDQQEYWNERPAFPAPRIIKCNDNRSPGKGEGKTWSIYERWQPQASCGKVLIPKEMWRTDERGVPINIVEFFKTHEWQMFPKGKDNLFDAGKLIWEDKKRVGELPWPKAYGGMLDMLNQPRQKQVNSQSAGIM